MAVLKAIRINKTNKQDLEAKYQMSAGFLEYSSGLYLIAEFAATTYSGILTKPGFEAGYNVIREIDNGFFEVEKKVAV